MSGYSLSLPPEAVEAIARRAAEIAIEEVRAESGASPWLTRAQAADYLAVPRSRLEKDRTIPCRRWDGRVLYNRHELDRWLDAFKND